MEIWQNHFLKKQFSSDQIWRKYLFFEKLWDICVLKKWFCQIFSKILLYPVLCNLQERAPNAFYFFLSPLPLTFSFCAVKLFRNAAVSFSIYMRLRSFGQKTPSFSRGLLLAAGSYAHNSLWASARRLPCGSFAHPLRARRQPPRLATEYFSFFHDFMGQLCINIRNCNSYIKKCPQPE